MTKSAGQTQLEEILTDLFPQERFEYEYHVGDRLRLDIFMPKYNIGIEYHGRQHFEYVEFHHKNKTGFLEAVNRDFSKVEACKDLGITLVVFTHKDKLDKDLVYERVLHALQNPVEEKPRAMTYEEKRKERAREYRREKYREAKRKRNRQ